MPLQVITGQFRVVPARPDGVTWARRRGDGMRVLLVSGSTRAGSTNTAVLRTAPGVAPDGLTTVRYGGLAELPAFNPDHDPLPRAVAELRAQLAGADAVLVCTPEYAGALPGALKNLLDWTVGWAGMQRRPVGWVNVASLAAPTGGAGAHGELATVLGYLGADVIAGACVQAPMSRGDVDPDGLVTSAAVLDQLRTALRALRDHVTAAVPD